MSSGGARVIPTQTLLTPKQGTKKTYKKKSKNNEHTGEDMDRSRQTTEHKDLKQDEKRRRFLYDFLFLAERGSTHVCPAPRLPPRRLLDKYASKSECPGIAPPGRDVKKPPRRVLSSSTQAPQRPRFYLMCCVLPSWSRVPLVLKKKKTGK